MSLGELFSFNALLGYFLGPLNRLVNLQPKVQEALVSADRIMEILELDEEFEEDPEKTRVSRYIRPEKIEGEIQLKNVDFTYGTRRQVLFDINVFIKKGEWVAFVGESGSGKSTLVKLLLKFYKPQNGDIVLDNNNLEDLDTFYLRSKIGYVPQDIFLFSGTIADNISLHKSDATIEDIIEASKKAGAHEFISKLPGRYNTRLSERGSSLSGGERQRIALARALLGKPELLIFDEATSSLDNISERSIHETLKNLRKEKVTTILIAHRLTTVINCDKIFVMEHGRIVEEGTHEQLKVNKGLYQKLWESSK
jgi:ATP-binding cassette subfamily B protein